MFGVHPMFAVGGGAGYQIQNSLRFRASNSAYLNRTPSSAGNRKTWTWSAWVKRGALSGATSMSMFVCNRAATADSTYSSIQWSNTNNFVFSGYATNWRWTSAVFRDPSAWYHLVVALDTTQSTAANRVKLYVNGVEQTSFTYSSDPTLNADLGINQAALHSLGQDVPGGPAFFDGYMANVYFIDGQQLTPSAFGQTDATTGVWVPKAYSGTYGTNGFFLQFKDATSTTTIGYDTSGNSNNFTTSGISVTSGGTFDQMTDTPTLNYSVMSAIDKGANMTTSNASLRISNSSGGSYERIRASIGMTTGKWYSEFVIDSEGSPSRIGAGLMTGSAGITTSYLGNGDALSWTIYESAGSLYKVYNSTATLYASGQTLDPTDIHMLAYDADAGKFWYGKNGTWFSSGNPAAGTNEMFSSVSVSGQAMFFAAYAYNTSDVGTWNFGQRAFAYTPPTGFKALSTANLTSTAVTTSGSFTGNAAADGPFVWTNGNPATLTINGNSVTFGTHADKTAGGFKLRTSSASYNASGSNTWTSTAGKRFVQSKKPNNAQANP